MWAGAAAMTRKTSGFDSSNSDNFAALVASFLDRALILIAPKHHRNKEGAAHILCKGHFIPSTRAKDPADGHGPLFGMVFSTESRCYMSALAKHAIAEHSKPALASTLAFSWDSASSKVIVKNVPKPMSLDECIAVDYAQLGGDDMLDILHIYAVSESKVCGHVHIKLVSIREFASALGSVFGAFLAENNILFPSTMLTMIRSAPARYTMMYPVGDKHSRCDVINQLLLARMFRRPSSLNLYPPAITCNLTKMTVDDLAEIGGGGEDDIVTIPVDQWFCGVCGLRALWTARSENVYLSSTALFHSLRQWCNLRFTVYQHSLHVFGQSPTVNGRLKTFFLSAKSKTSCGIKHSHCFGDCYQHSRTSIANIDFLIAHGNFAEQPHRRIVEAVVQKCKLFCDALCQLSEADVVAQYHDLCIHGDLDKAMTIARKFACATYLRWCADFIVNNIVRCPKDKIIGPFIKRSVDPQAPVNHPRPVPEPESIAETRAQEESATLRAMRLVCKPQCPVCRSPYERQRGCFAMRCHMCGAEFCHGCARQCPSGQPRTAWQMFRMLRRSPMRAGLTMSQTVREIRRTFAVCWENEANLKMIEEFHGSCDYLDAPGSAFDTFEDLVPPVKEKFIASRGDRAGHALPGSRMMTCPLTVGNYTSHDACGDEEGMKTLFSSAARDVRIEIGRVAGHDEDPHESGSDILIRLVRIMMCHDVSVHDIRQDLEHIAMSTSEDGADNLTPKKLAHSLLKTPEAVERLVKSIQVCQDRLVAAKEEAKPRTGWHGAPS